MTRLLRRATLLCFVLLLTAPLASVAADSPYGSLAAYPAAAPLTMDGFADDWGVAGLEPTLIVHPNVSFMNEGTVASPDELSADVYLLYDDAYLYVVARVTDDNVVGTGANVDIWRNSVVELWLSFSGAPTNPAAYAEYTTEDYQINVTPMTSGRFAPQSWVYPAIQQHHNDANPVQTAASLWSQGELRGYIIEARVPKDTFPGTAKVAAGNTIRFAVSIVHNDKSGTRDHVWTPGVNYADITVK